MKRRIGRNLVSAGIMLMGFTIRAGRYGTLPVALDPIVKMETSVIESKNHVVYPIPIDQIPYLCESLHRMWLQRKFDGAVPKCSMHIGWFGWEMNVRASPKMRTSKISLTGNNGYGIAPLLGIDRNERTRTSGCER